MKRAIGETDRRRAKQIGQREARHHPIGISSRYAT